MVIAEKTICVEACFQARPSNKNICCIIFVVFNIDDWLHYNRFFSFKMKWVYKQFEDFANNRFINRSWQIKFSVVYVHVLKF